MLIPNFPNTPFNGCINEECTSLLIMPEKNTGTKLSPTPKYSNSAKTSIVGILGGELNRKKKELVGRVLQQRKIFGNPCESAVANARATEVATNLTFGNLLLGEQVWVHSPRFLTASFSRKQGNRFRQALDWMLENKVDVLVTMDEWMDQLISEYSFVGNCLKSSCNTKLPGVTIWTVRNPFEILLKNSLNEEHLFSAFSEQYQCL
ncbi:hypothetical protein [Lewinella cohaerens]|uniref:hypothetical protein n=1 Tax=Lewinella cohaerens TaxID=70995 RepID=UPI0003661DEB|nr:hypothetical protein [Lewinella cohaerens]